MGFFNKLPKSALIVGAVVMVAVVGAGVAYGMSAHNRRIMEEAVNIDYIYDGISVDNIDVSGKTQVEAYEFLQKTLTAKTAMENLSLSYNEQTWEIPFTDVSAQYDLEDAVKIAWETGRSGDLRERYKIVTELKEKGLNIDADYGFDEELLTEKLNEVAVELDKEAVDSSLKRSGGKFIIGKSQKGYALNVEKTAEAAKLVVAEKNGGAVDPVVDVIEPKITEEDNAKVDALIGTYFTTYSANAKSRNENLRIGSENISETVLAPGDVFSMNVELGPQTYENGYKDAGVYVNGKVEQGVGGGVCQITSTLYNAVILAELEVVERYPHSMTVGYVPLGRDSAVAGTYKDLKFKNNTDAPIYIEAYAKDGKQVCNIYGKEVHEAGRKLEYETVYEQTIAKPAEKVTQDPNLLEGERKITATGKTGSKVSVYKKVFQGDKLVSREWFSNSTYMATPDEVTVGTGKPTEMLPTEGGENTDGQGMPTGEEVPLPEPTV